LQYESPHLIQGPAIPAIWPAGTWIDGFTLQSGL
jgi:hypothetical protein